MSVAEQETHPSQKEAEAIFSSANIQEKQTEPVDYSEVARSLARKTYAAQKSGGGPSVYIWSTILALKQCAISQPHSLDRMLLIFDEATELYSEAVSNEYGHGATAGKQQLKWWITEESDGFKGLIFPGNAGRDAENDRSNLDFSDNEVNEIRGESWHRSRRGGKSGRPGLLLLQYKQDVALLRSFA